MGTPYALQSNSGSQTELRRRVRPDDVVLPVMSTASLAPAGRVKINEEEFVTYTGFGTDAVGMPTLTGCTRGANREQGGSAARDWPGGTYVMQAPYERPELVSALPDATADQAGRQVYLDEQEPALSFFGEDDAGSSRRDLTTPDTWSAPFVSAWGVAGSGDGQFNGDIRGIAVDPVTGNVYVSSDNRIQKFNSTGTWLATIATSGSGDGQVNAPGGLHFGISDGRLYVADTGNNRIQVFSGDAFVAKFGTFGSGDTQFNAPLGVFASRASIFVADTGNDRISRWVLATLTWAANFTGSEALDAPSGVALDWTLPYGATLPNFVWTVDSGNHRVKLTSDGTRTIIGEQGRARGQFNNPYSIALDARGNLYITDTGNDRVQVFDNKGIFRGFFGQSGSDNGEFDGPTAIAITDSYIYVGDSANRRIQIFSNPIAPQVGQTEVFAFQATGGVSNSSTATFADTVNQNIMLPVGTWTIIAEWKQAFSATTVANVSAEGRMLIGATTGTTMGWATLNAERTTIVIVETITGVTSDGFTAINIQSEFRRTATFAATPTSDIGALTLICQRTA